MPERREGCEKGFFGGRRWTTSTAESMVVMLYLSCHPLEKEDHMVLSM
jgi:hypothetical protein